MISFDNQDGRIQVVGTIWVEDEIIVWAKKDFVIHFFRSRVLSRVVDPAPPTSDKLRGDDRTRNFLRSIGPHIERGLVDKLQSRLREREDGSKKQNNKKITQELSPFPLPPFFELPFCLLLICVLQHRIPHKSQCRSMGVSRLGKGHGGVALPIYHPSISCGTLLDRR